MNKIRFGILGCGGIAARFAGALNHSPEAELYACAARDSFRAEDFAGKHGAKRFYGSYEDLLKDDNVDAVYIATINSTHAQLAQQCVLAGKPVLCEKPFFTTAKEAEETITLAAEKSVLMMEGMWTRTLPATLKVKEWLAAGKIGELKMIRAAFCFNMPYEHTKQHQIWSPELGGGALLDAGVYPFEYVTGIMDSPPEAVNFTVQHGPTGVDTTVAFSMQYPGMAADCLTSISGWMDDTAILSGSEGFIRQYRFWGSRKAELCDSAGRVLESFEDPQEEGFIHEIAHFAGLVREGKLESQLIPLRDSLDFAKTADLILGRE